MWKGILILVVTTAAASAVGAIVSTSVSEYLKARKKA